MSDQLGLPIKSHLGCVARDADRRVLWLANDLSIPVYAAIGIVESLRLWVKYEIRKGNIGKYSDDDIAMSLFYEGNGKELIDALCRVGWVRHDPECRLRLVGYSWKRGDCKTRRRDRIKLAGGDVPRWLRLRIYQRDRYQCLYCTSTEDLTIDHITPVAVGGRTEESNLQTLCRSCNSSKGMRYDNAPH